MAIPSAKLPEAVLLHSLSAYTGAQRGTESVAHGGPFSLQSPTNLRVGVTLEDPGSAWQQREDFHLPLLEDYFGESPQGSARSLDSVSDFAGLRSDKELLMH